VGEGDTSRLSDLRVLFLPTGPLQDIAVHGSWHDRYIALAGRFDELTRR